MKLNKIMMLVIGIVVVLAVVIVYLTLNPFGSSDDNTTEKPVKNQQDVFDINGIPTPETVAHISEETVKKVWGETFENLSEKEKLVVPNSGVTFDAPVFTSNTELAVLTVMAYLENPYLQSDAGDTIRTMPDGTSIDMRLLKSEYSDLRFYGYSDDTSKYVVKGNRNGEYFEQAVDLITDKIN